MKKILTILPFVLIVIIVILIKMYVVTVVQVDGRSMVPTLKDNEIVVLNKLDKSFKRFDVVVFNYDNDLLIKRIIGLPGEYVEYKNNQLYINGKQIEETFSKNNETRDYKMDEIKLTKIPKDCYFLVGDNRKNSTDSRVLGVVNKKLIQGKSGFKLFPFSSFGKYN